MVRDIIKKNYLQKNQYWENNLILLLITIEKSYKRIFFLSFPPLDQVN